MRKFQVLFLLVSILSSSFAFSKPDPIKYRKSVYQIMGWHFGIMAAMAKGKKDYDRDSFIRSAAILRFVSNLPLEGFPVGSENGNTKAKPEIWLDMKDFEAKMLQMQQEVNILEDIANTGDLRKAKKQIGKVGRSCKSCHDKYKTK